MASARAEQGLLGALGIPRLTVGKHPFIKSQAGEGEKRDDDCQQECRSFGLAAQHCWYPWGLFEDPCAACCLLSGDVRVR